MNGHQLMQGSEREILVAMLDDHRSLMVKRCSGLDDEQLQRTVGASDLTLGRLLRHLTIVEDSWFSWEFDGQEPWEPWRSADWASDPDWEMTTADGMPGEQLVADYEAACDRGRAIVERSQLDDVSTKPTDDGHHFTLRWLLVHMIEETAQHNGHADLIRESIDGQRG